MSDKNPTLLYFFEHIFLKNAFFESPEFITGLKGDLDSFSKNLISNFNRIKENPDNGLQEKDVVLQEGDLKCEAITLEDGSDMVLITCPTPRQPPEAKFVGIVLGNTPRYFVSEYETNDMTKQLYPDKDWPPKYILCEWIDKQHREYNKTPNTREDFIKAVSEILSSQN